MKFTTANYRVIAARMTTACAVAAFSVSAFASPQKPLSNDVVQVGTSAPATSPQSNAQEPAKPFKAISDDTVVAEVNGDKITMKPINETVARFKKKNQKLLKRIKNPNGMLKAVRKGKLHELIDFELLFQEAKRRKIVPDTKKVDAQLWQIKAKFPSSDAYQKWLKDTGKTEQELLGEIAKNQMVEKLGNQLSVDVTVSDGDLQQFYNDNKARFTQPPSVDVKHILIAIPPKATDAQKAKLKKKAEKILKEARKSNSSFSSLAAADSDDPVSAKKGGDLGLLVKVDKGPWKPLVNAAFAANSDHVIDHLVESDFGYHIVKVGKKEPANVIPLNDEVREKIKPLVLHNKIEKMIQAEVAKLRKKATVKTLVEF